MKRLLILACLFAAPAPALAQPQPDPAALQRALAAVQSQRNQAMDIAAGQQARADGLADELAKVQTKLKELEPKSKPKKD